jgi:hypothetical protein
MSDIVPKIGQNIFDAQVQVKEPSAKYLTDPCVDIAKTDGAELTVLFPDTSDSIKKTVPAMGGSIVKISLGATTKTDEEKRKYAAYLEGINDKEITIFNSETIAKMEKGSTSSLRVNISRLFVESISSDLNIDGIPNLYLSSTIEDLATLDKKTDYFGIIRKNAKFAFIPIEAITEVLKDISRTTYNGNPIRSTIGSWSGLSGRKFSSNDPLETDKNLGLYEIALTADSAPDEDIICLIMDMIPFLNLSEKEMLEDPVTPVLGGYFTIIGNNIYLKMPDFSGIDSAGYGSDYITNSELKFLFQLITKEKATYSVKNIELKTYTPISADIVDYPEDYFLNSGEEFSITFSSNAKPSSVYLSPAIEDKVVLKTLKGISASQSGSFIEYNPYPNPFVSITHNDLVIKKNNLAPKYTKASGIDQPYSGVYFSYLQKIRKKIDAKYNQGLYKSGSIEEYVQKISPFPERDIVATDDPTEYFGVGFPFDQDLLLSKDSGGALGQTLSAYEFSGNLSRQNLILHNGIAAKSSSEEYSGKKGNNSKYFKKNFIANSAGLCENYRPKVFSTPSKFIPSTWIESSNITNDGDYFVAKFSVQKIKEFYSDSATNMKFVVYANDGHNQISKFENGYLAIEVEAPEITAIVPDGTRVDAKIIKCDNVEYSGQSNILIQTTSAKYITAVKINGFEIKKDSSWKITGSSLSLTIPCQPEIIEGVAEVVIVQGDVSSAPTKIYIANGYNTIVNTADVNDLPNAVSGASDFSSDEISSKNLFINGPSHNIPICYADPRSKIEIKSKKKIFKDGRSIYLYVGFDTEDIAKKFSQNNASISRTGETSGTIWVAKDFNYELSNSLLSDFYRKNKKKAQLFFPGNAHSTKPLSLLYSDVSKAYLILSTKSPSEFSDDGKLGILELGSSSNNAFYEPPLVVGMAASFYGNNVQKNHLNNFNNVSQPEYKSIAEKILKEIGISNSKPLEIDIEDKFKKLVVLFKYRELIKFKKKYFDLYIKDTKVSKSFSLEGIKKASDLDLSPIEEIDAKNLYYFVISDVNISSSDPATVRIDISDHDFSIKNTTQNKYIDYSARISSSLISKSTSPDSSSIFINDPSQQIIAQNNGVGSLLGSYASDLALTGLFINDFSNNILNFGTYPKAAINSSISGKISSIKEPSSSDKVVELSKYSDSDLLSEIPNSYFTISSGSEVYFNQYIEGKDDYLIFLRLQVTDICKIGVLTPKITAISSTILSPGDVVVLTAENFAETFVVEISGIQAKIVGVKEVTATTSEISLIVPEGIPTIVSVEDCGWLLYNGNQVLNRGINQLGKQMANTLDRAAAGYLSDITNQFQGLKDKLALHPIRFVGTLMDKANLAKEFLTSFCNFSFKIVGDLTINLQGFSQLLIPIKVLLCLIDVICNLFNPFQLPSAIIRLFECLYDLILLLPQISVPVMFLNLLIHLLDLLECLVVKVLNLVVVINLFIDAIAEILATPERISFRDLMVLEELLLKYVVSVEADLELLTPITQVLAIFLQLLQLTFRFPCSINPNSIDAPCGIDGFEVGAMVSGLIAEKTGSEPHASYIFKKEYLLPISQPFTKVASESATPPSYNNATEPDRGSTIFDGTEAVDGNLYDLSYFNPNSLRKKDSTFDPETGDITDIETDTYVSLAASYTKRRKTFESSQSVIFKFNSRTWKSAILPEVVDQQVIDESKAFDTPLVLLSKNSENLNIAEGDSYGSFYSLLDGKEMMTTPVDGAASIIPLTIDIVQNGVTVQRTFNTIPSMLLLDEEFNVYVVNDGGIIFGEYKDLSGNTVTGITEIRATVINKQSSTPDAFDKEDEVIGTDPSDENIPVTRSIFSLPQLYFVDTRVAAESIQAKCETSSINQIPLDLSGDGGVGEVEKMSGCLQDFLSAITSQTNQIKTDLSLGKVPTKMSQDKVSSAYGTLIDCTNNSIDNVCSIVINPLNTSFLLLADNDETPILPDTSLPADILSGFQASGPVFTGAREYAAGIGDAATVTVGNLAVVEIIPRDSYDNLIYYDLSPKIRIEIISDSTKSAEIKLSPTEANDQNYLVYNETTKSYTASITAKNPGEVKIKASICNNPIQALTYSDLVVEDDSGQIGCVPDSNNTATDSGNIPLGALTRINRILTITFVSPDLVQTVITDFGMGDTIITQPQLFGTNLEN